MTPASKINIECICISNLEFVELMRDYNSQNDDYSATGMKLL